MLAVSVETASKQELGGVGGLVFGFQQTPAMTMQGGAKKGECQ